MVNPQALPSYPVVTHVLTGLNCVCVSGDSLEREQDTVLQLQEVIEQLRNVFPSEPGECI